MVLVPRAPAVISVLAVLLLAVQRCCVFVARSLVPILCYPIYLTIAILRRMSTNFSSIDPKIINSAEKPNLLELTHERSETGFLARILETRPQIR
ncbi:MAG: hypothetical protein WBA89_16750 [Microcoleus sp.]|uniref:hypothetical protein n=1 Tax=Microcoleus sp. TaxID=44472 RepID=UPI003C743FFE